VQFGDERSSILSRLEVEAPNSRDLLGELLQALFELRIQVVACETRVESANWSAALSLVEFDGATIRAKRRAEVQATVFGVLEDSLRGRSRARRQRIAALEVASG
jgi:Holliday junction resolvasome RuvABC endonuclease subunit